jgi:tetratricopeptide (TPR) repeat protein
MDHLAKIAEGLRRGEYLHARRLAEAVLALEEASPADKALAAQLGAEAAYALRDDMAAVALARRAVDLARGSGDAQTEGRALFRLAAALTAVGDYHLALEHQREFVEGMEIRWPELDAELGAKAFGNLGLIYRSRRRPPEALQAYWQALSRFQAAGQAEGEIYTRQQMAWLLTQMGELEEAEEHLQASGERLTLDGSGHLAVIQLTHEALLRLGQGRYPEAVDLAREVLVPGREAVSEANRAVALYVSGMCALRTGQLGIARMFLGMAREAALSSSLASTMNLVQELARALKESEPA